MTSHSRIGSESPPKVGLVDSIKGYLIDLGRWGWLLLGGSAVSALGVFLLPDHTPVFWMISACLCLLGGPFFAYRKRSDQLHECQLNLLCTKDELRALKTPTTADLGRALRAHVASVADRSLSAADLLSIIAEASGSVVRTQQIRGPAVGVLSSGTDDGIECSDKFALLLRQLCNLALVHVTDDIHYPNNGRIVTSPLGREVLRWLQRTPER